MQSFYSFHSPLCLSLSLSRRKLGAKLLHVPCRIRLTLCVSVCFCSGSRTGRFSPDCRPLTKAQQSTTTTVEVYAHYELRMVAQSSRIRGPQCEMRMGPENTTIMLHHLCCLFVRATRAETWAAACLGGPEPRKRKERRGEDNCRRRACQATGAAVV